ncbi:MAG: STAS domain-containing protein, partial [Gammaproteobacteria bacterium]|nr:STAS domain-containing protein [Gammaproteobacteria bacterium]
KSGMWKMDAHQLQEIDSSTLSFFLECLRTANRNKIDLKISCLSAKIKALLQVYGVAHLFKNIIED